MNASFISKVAILTVGIISGSYSMAQNNPTKKDKKEIIRIKMIKNINGVETTIDTTINSSDFVWDIDIPEMQIEQQIDSVMKTIEIEVAGIEDQLDQMGKELENLDIIKEINVADMIDLKDLEELGNIQIDFNIDSISSLISNNISIEKLKFLSNISDSNVTVIVLDEDDAEYQKILEEMKSSQNGDYKMEKQIVIVEEDDEEGIKGDRKMLEIRMVISSCKIDDLNKDDKKLLKSEGLLSNENLKIEQLNFYPNPNNGRFSLAFTLPKQGDTEISIFSTEGKNVYKDILPNFTGTYKKEIDISNNGKGIYFIKVSQNGRSTFKKMIIE